MPPITPVAHASSNEEHCCREAELLQDWPSLLIEVLIAVVEGKHETMPWLRQALAPTTYGLAERQALKALCVQGSHLLVK
jgi:hypothetical protein